MAICYFLLIHPINVFCFKYPMFLFLGTDLLNGGNKSVFKPRLDAENTLAQVVIAANDGTMGQLEFSHEFLFLNTTEKNKTLKIAVRRALGTYGDVSVFIYSQTRLNALLNRDYGFSARELYFQSGENLKSVDVTILDDELPEADESFELVLAIPKGGASLGARVAQITILENDGAGGKVEFASNASITLQEAFSQGGFSTSATLLLTSGPGLFGNVDIGFTVLDSSNNLTLDLIPSSGIVTFVEQQAVASINLRVLNDDIPEFEESFTVELTSAFSSLLGNKLKREIVILASDAPNGLLSITTRNQTNVNVEEENDFVTCQIYRSAGLKGEVTAGVKTISEMATAELGTDVYVEKLQVFDFEAMGFCSYGAYLLALNVSNGTRAELLKWDGLYRHVAYIEGAHSITCLFYLISNRVHFVMISGAVEGTVQVDSYVYAITEDEDVTMLHAFTSRPPVAATIIVNEESIELAMITSLKQGGMPAVTLEKYMIEESGVALQTSWPLTSQATLTVHGNLAIIAQKDSVLLYDINEVSWTLKQTIVTEAVDVTAGFLADEYVLLVVLADNLLGYRLNGSTFVKEIEIPFFGGVRARGFQLGDEQLFLVFSKSSTVILHWSGSGFKEVWKAEESLSFIPIVAPISTSYSLFLAATGRDCHISVVAMLEEPDFIPRSVRICLEFVV